MRPASSTESWAQCCATRRCRHGERASGAARLRARGDRCAPAVGRGRGRAGRRARGALCRARQAGGRRARRREPPRDPGSGQRSRSRPGAAPVSVREALYPVELQELVDAYLRELPLARAAGTEGLQEAMRYSLLAGGKRTRPVLCLATAEALGHEHEEVLPLAAAMEMIHTYSLIHDDLPAMDDDELRRGKPTCHVAFGEDVAILAGDGLFAEALRLALTEQAGEPANVLAAVSELVAAAGLGGMVGGQYLDISIETGRADIESTDPVVLRQVQELKTGALIGASVGSVLR